MAKYMITRIKSSVCKIEAADKESAFKIGVGLADSEFHRKDEWIQAEEEL